MKTYLVGYDLNRPRGESAYADLISALKNFGTYWHDLDSTWVIKSNWSAAQIRDMLKPYIDSGDELLVVGLTGESAWAGFNTTSDWLRAHIPSS